MITNEEEKLIEKVLANLKLEVDFKESWNCDGKGYDTILKLVYEPPSYTMKTKKIISKVTL